MPRHSFLERLKRARLPRVLIVYLGAAWVVLEVTDTLQDILALPDWTAPVAFVLLLCGLLVIVATAWVQSTPGLDAREEAGDVPDSWDVGVQDIGRSLRAGRLPHLTWGRTVVGGAVVFSLLFGLAGAYVLFRSVESSPAPPDDGDTAGPIRSVAVLPLDNLTGDDGQAYFVDGMHEALISELARIEELTVLSRTSTLRYRETDRTVGEIARELGTQGLIEGSVFRSGDSVRITAQLVRGSPEEHLWAQSYTGDISRALSLHSRVARAIADAIRLTLTPHEERRLAAADSVDPRAQDAYLQGRALWRTRQLENLARAVELMEQAVALDPTFARAYAGLADARQVHTLYASALERWPLERTLAAYGRTRQAARRALELDPGSAEANATLGYAAMLSDLDWDHAERRLRTSLELNPSYSQAWDWLADLLNATGRTGEAVDAMRKATELDPFSPLMHRDLGYALSKDGHCPEATDAFLRALELDPAHWAARSGLFGCALQEGRETEAVEQLAQLVALTSPEEAGALREAYREHGWAGALEHSVDQGLHRFVIDEVMALIALGRLDDAMALLRTGYEHRWVSVLVSIKTATALDPLRDRPDFQALLRDMNLAE